MRIVARATPSLTGPRRFDCIHIRPAWFWPRHVARQGLATVLLFLVGASACWAKVPRVKHEPQQPKSGEAVRVTAELKDTPRSTGWLLEYQIVEPGNYIALHDPAFQSGWTAVKMETAATGGGASGDAMLVGQLPPELQKHRRLIRYRIRSAGDQKIVAPAPADAQPNFAYFVYDGVPPWRGAINPKSGEEKVRTPTTYPSEALQRVPVYHFISSKASVEKATWLEPTPWEQREGRNAYKYTGTMVYDGVVYDHVPFRARGGEWRHAMGKNMWKFNFLRGHHFQARDDYGAPYQVKWDKLNLGACIQQGDAGMRGEAGMFEAVGFRLFNLAGVEAPHTHWVHLRIIDDVEENPSDQYSGDFWGLYLATENVDDYFLKEHDLPAGNLYKMEFWQPKVAFNGNPAITNRSDAMRFISQIMRGTQTSVSWWQENVDLSSYYSYRSIIECIHHYDLDAGKNFFFYFHPQSHQWIIFPWDIDLSWGEHMYGAGFEPFYRAGLLFRSPFKEQYQERLAELRDLLFNPEQVGQLIDEHARMIADPSGAPSLVDADRAKWDFHPIMASPHVLLKRAGQGRFYFANVHDRFPVMVDYMKTYAARRGDWIDQKLLADYRPPAPPQIETNGVAKGTDTVLSFRSASKPENMIQKIHWRLAEMTDTSSPAFDPHQPWKYEIQPVWQKELKDEQTVEVPTSLLRPGHLYRVRARWADTSGHWSRWSKPIEFTAQEPSLK
jgi:CotH kinase protein